MQLAHDVVEEYDFVKDALRQAGMHQFPAKDGSGVCGDHFIVGIQVSKWSTQILEPDSAESTQFSEINLDRGVAQSAFQVPYVSHPDDDEFVTYLELQRRRLNTNPSSYAPSASIIS